jgi:tRNA(adenine34) deaminase
MHDANQDRLMIPRMTDFRVKRTRLGETYRRFLPGTLPRGATLFLATGSNLAGGTPIAGNSTMAEKKAKKGRWVRNVTTVSTYPPEGLFTKDAAAIAQAMASKKVSPKGIGSGIRMIQFFINRAGKNLPAERKAELEKAKRLLRAKAREKDGGTRNAKSGRE